MERAWKNSEPRRPHHGSDLALTRHRHVTSWVCLHQGFESYGLQGAASIDFQEVTHFLQSTKTSPSLVEVRENDFPVKNIGLMEDRRYSMNMRKTHKTAMTKDQIPLSSCKTNAVGM